MHKLTSKQFDQVLAKSIFSPDHSVQSKTPVKQLEEAEFFCGNLPKILTKNDVHGLFSETSGTKPEKYHLYIKKSGNRWVTLKSGVCKVHRFNMQKDTNNGFCFIKTSKEKAEKLLKLSGTVYYKDLTDGIKYKLDIKPINLKLRKKAEEAEKAKNYQKTQVNRLVQEFSESKKWQIEHGNWRLKS